MKCIPWSNLFSQRVQNAYHKSPIAVVRHIQHTVVPIIPKCAYSFPTRVNAWFLRAGASPQFLGWTASSFNMKRFNSLEIIRKIYVFNRPYSLNVLQLFSKRMIQTWVRWFHCVSLYKKNTCCISIKAHVTDLGGWNHSSIFGSFPVLAKLKRGGGFKRKYGFCSRRPGIKLTMFALLGKHLFTAEGKQSAQRSILESAMPVTVHAYHNHNPTWTVHTCCHTF